MAVVCFRDVSLWKIIYRERQLHFRLEVNNNNNNKSNNCNSKTSLSSNILSNAGLLLQRWCYICQSSRCHHWELPYPWQLPFPTSCGVRPWRWSGTDIHKIPCEFIRYWQQLSLVIRFPLAPFEIRQLFFLSLCSSTFVICTICSFDCKKFLPSCWLKKNIFFAIAYTESSVGMGLAHTDSISTVIINTAVSNNSHM